MPHQKWHAERQHLFAMASSPPSSSPLVWVTQGKSQHAASLLETRESDKTCLIRWNSTNKIQRVPQRDVANALAPRPRRRPLIDCEFSDDENEENMLMDVDDTGGLTGEKRKTATRDAIISENNKDDESSDEVQVLLTIQPPTPKRPKQDIKNQLHSDVAPNEVRRVSTSPQPQKALKSAHNEHDDGSAQLQTQNTDEDTDSAVPLLNSTSRSDSEITVDVSKSRCLSTPPEVSNAATEPAAGVSKEYESALCTDEKPATRSQNSAHLQALAEICFTILNDARWRVDGALEKRLFAWEEGEDLSAVLTLSKLYQPPKRKRERKCPCLLCRDEQDKDDSSHINESTASTEEEDVFQSSNQSPEADERTVQALYLYSRLYYRKGPWFRLDNLFKYYISENTSSSDDEIESDAEQDENECGADSVLKERRNSFFERSSSSQLNEGSNNGRQSNAKKDSVIDESKLEERMLEAARMFRDVGHLMDCGLVRSFHDEEECGKTVGAVTPEGFGILTEPERSTIVKKLGGHGKKQKKLGISAQEGKQVAANENAIWKQMCQQKSISFDPTSCGPMAKSLLPVRRHVDDLLLEKLATTIVSSSSQHDYIPSAIRKPTVAAVKARLLELCSPGPRSVSMCLKLREAPLLTLRRCARLYICATLGPGDMRGDGTNAWTSLRDFDTTSIHPDVPLPTVVRPPGSHSWHRVVHPGQHYRFGIASCAFVDSHEFIDCQNELDDKSSELAGDIQNTVLHVQVFSTVSAFRLWESSVELRAHVDYHLELAEMLAWRARKQQQREQREEEETVSDEPERGDRLEEGGCNQNVEASSVLSLTSEGDVPLDFLGLLTEKGRRLFIEDFLLSSSGFFERQDVGCLAESVEHGLSSLKVCKSVSSKEDELFQNDSERLVVVFSVLISRLFAVKNEQAAHEMLASKQGRPWLRHLWWDGVLAYALWDCVPLLERKGFYELACSCLEIVLFGKAQKRDMDSSQAYGQNFERTALSHLLLSRRARGKAHERLVIDYKHLLDWRLEVASRNAGIDSGTARDAQTKGRRKVSLRLPVAMLPRDVIRGVCSRVIGAVASTGRIPFSAVRSLARKMKQPLVKSLDTLSCIEAEALGIRLENRNVASSAEDSKSEELKGYADWTPPTDFAVANAMVGEASDVGKRCSYVGFEDNAVVDVADPSSLNVEELAMHYYSTGRLPVSEPGDLQGGGWTGWHDEGGLLRALFRIICAHPILGMDLGCGKESSGNALDSLERLTIHLTPYQGAPFDLHVAHSLDRPLSFDTGADKSDSPIRSFYSRRRLQIDTFLGKLERLNSQDLCDLVYDSIVCRLDQGRAQDTLLDRDLQQVRTLSMLAAGFGGQLLSVAFRCLLFDYRHYSGGLPDLLLVRALSTAEHDSSNKSLIDLGEWIGEEFGAEAKIAREAAARSSLLIDKDDEYLGCSKMGDSGGQSSSRWKRGGQRRQSSGSDMAKQPNGQSKYAEKLPPRLVLRHNDKDVKVQCLFVEVKSQNDRLDGRQEDWLNILDRVGNARVCKFGSGKKKSSKSKASGKSAKKAPPTTE